jgi:hypothetical protein
MPYVMDWPPKRILALAAVGVAFLVGAPAASADSTCPSPPSSNVFSQFGDDASYSLVPGGDFEGDTSGWSLDNASVVQGNEPWNIGSPSDSQSLSIGAGGTAVSPSFCVSNQFPMWRFFAQSAGHAWGASGLSVSLQWTDDQGNSGQTRIASLRGGIYRSWSPTRPLVLGEGMDDNTTLSARLVFQADKTSWSIDDIYIDPYAK